MHLCVVRSPRPGPHEIFLTYLCVPHSRAGSHAHARRARAKSGTEHCSIGSGIQSCSCPPTTLYIRIKLQCGAASVSRPACVRYVFIGTDSRMFWSSISVPMLLWPVSHSLSLSLSPSPSLAPSSLHTHTEMHKLVPKLSRVASGVFCVVRGTQAVITYRIAAAAAAAACSRAPAPQHGQIVIIAPRRQRRRRPRRPRQRVRPQRLLYCTLLLVYMMFESAATARINFIGHAGLRGALGTGAKIRHARWLARQHARTPTDCGFLVAGAGASSRIIASACVSPSYITGVGVGGGWAGARERDGQRADKCTHVRTGDILIVIYWSKQVTNSNTNNNNSIAIMRSGKISSNILYRNGFRSWGGGVRLMRCLVVCWPAGSAPV